MKIFGGGEKNQSPSAGNAVSYTAGDIYGHISQGMEENCSENKHAGRTRTKYKNDLIINKREMVKVMVYLIL